ncbi:MAG: peptidoglycan bridge formation glycyltransferase FemA/FemB family protein [Erysipelotrichaceae bacterium]|nr:peptidoglycan bridge formation glycyltransferase FemA/FemB family protein [Erysipelotrichaceae bacterium]
MPILDQNNPTEVSRYIAFTKTFRNAHFYQDYRWSYVKNNLKCECVYLETEGVITAACTVYIRPIAAGLSILYGQRGPLCDLSDPTETLALIKEMKPLVKKYHAFMIKFDPNVQDSEQMRQNFQNAGFKIRGEGYSKLDLILSRRSMVLDTEGKTLEELLPQFKPGTRYNCKKSQRNGLEVIEGYTKENLDVFMNLLEITARRDGIEHRPREFFENIFEHFTREEARLYLIKHEDDYLAGALGVNYGGRMMYYHSGSSNIKRNKLPNYLMQCELINWACETGCFVYDMGGIIRESDEDGLYQFKIGFCIGNPMDEYIGELDYPIHPVLYFGFNVAYKWLQRIRRRMVLRKINKESEK